MTTTTRDKIEAKQYCDVECMQLLADNYTDLQITAMAETIKLIHKGLLKTPEAIHSFYCHKYEIIEILGDDYPK